MGSSNKLKEYCLKSICFAIKGLIFTVPIESTIFILDKKVHQHEIRFIPIVFFQIKILTDIYDMIQLWFPYLCIYPYVLTLPSHHKELDVTIRHNSKHLSM